jgi:hypothetical protein
VVQGEGPEFKPQHWKEKKKAKEKELAAVWIQDLEKAFLPGFRGLYGGLSCWMVCLVRFKKEVYDSRTEDGKL